MTNVAEVAMRNAEVARVRAVAHRATLTEVERTAGVALTAAFNAAVTAAVTAMGANTPWFA